MACGDWRPHATAFPGLYNKQHQHGTVTWGWRMRGKAQGGTRREGTSEAVPEAVRQAVGGGCQSGWGRLL